MCCFIPDCSSNGIRDFIVKSLRLMGGVKHEKKRGLKNLNPWVKKLNHGLKTQK